MYSKTTTDGGANAHQKITEIMSNPKFEIYYPRSEITALRECLIIVHENKEAVYCSPKEYEHYTAACPLFGLKPLPRLDPS